MIKIGSTEVEMSSLVVLNTGIKRLVKVLVAARCG